MNNQQYSSAKVYATFRRAVRKFMECARIDLRDNGNFKKMTPSQRAAVGRALANLDEVAAEPRKFFAPDFTEDAWRARARLYAQKDGTMSVADAYYMVQNPATIVWNMARSLRIAPELYSEFYKLCEDFMQWEYRRVSDVLSFGYSAPTYAAAVAGRQDFFERWEHEHRGAYEEWKKFKCAHPTVRKLVQKVR